MSVFADNCRSKYGTCEAWRLKIEDLTCSQPICPENSYFDECGSGCENTCDGQNCGNAKEGCYCNEGMVRSFPDLRFLSLKS